MSQPVLLDHHPAIKAKRVRVRPQERPYVGRPRQLGPVLLFKSAQVLSANLGSGLDLSDVETGPHSGLLEGGADFTHGWHAV